MDIEKIRNYCLSKNQATEDMPFGPDAIVFKVMGKMFALLILEKEIRLNLKCDPEKAIELRERFNSVLPGYHMNKKHWNTVNIDSSIPPEKIREWIDHSYEMVISGLPIKLKSQL